jgi:hypothetical protein
LEKAIEMRTTLSGLAGCALLALVASTPTVGQPATAAEPNPPTPDAAACRINDGTSSTGSPRGANPVRYEYGNSPYVGARYNSCLDVIKVYFGGYTNLTHYNLKSFFSQREMAPGPYRVATWTPEFPGNYVDTFTVQGCVRGGFPPHSHCTRWSPTVHVRVTP